MKPEAHREQCPERNRDWRLQPRQEHIASDSERRRKCTVISQFAIRVAAPSAADGSVSSDITPGKPPSVQESALDASGIVAKAIANGLRMRCRLPHRMQSSRPTLETYQGMYSPNPSVGWTNLLAERTLIEVQVRFEVLRR
jgi:hypothetical protein